MRVSSLRSTVYLAAIFGLVVSLFAMAEFLDASLRGICSVNSFFSCALVDESGKTTTFGIQDYLWGIGGFVLILALAAVWEKWPRDLRVGYGLLLLTTAGIAFALYFLYVELAEIHALCLVCAATYLFGVLAWAGTIGLVRKSRRGEVDPEPPAEEADAEVL